MCSHEFDVALCSITVTNAALSLSMVGLKRGIQRELDNFFRDPFTMLL